MPIHDPHERIGAVEGRPSRGIDGPCGSRRGESRYRELDRKAPLGILIDHRDDEDRAPLVVFT